MSVAGKSTYALSTPCHDEYNYATLALSVKLCFVMVMVEMPPPFSRFLPRDDESISSYCILGKLEAPAKMDKAATSVETAP